MSSELSAEEKQKYDSFFSSIKIISDFTEKTEERLASKLAPKFNYFDLFGPNENKISTILCDLLNINGRHGQGETFLSSFLETIGLEGFLPLRSVSVITEAPTSAGRRVDLLISTDKWVIGVENKPWASDQKDQLIDYYKHVRKIAGKNRNYAIVYLSGGDTAPSDLTREKIKEIGTEKSKFIMMRYCGSGFFHKKTTEPTFSNYTISNDLTSWLTQWS